MNQTELTPGPAWMFHDSRVGDAELAQAILEVLRPRLEMLLNILFATEGEAAQWVAGMVARAVVDRRRYWGRQSLSAWVLKGAPSVGVRQPFPTLSPPSCESEIDRCLWQLLQERLSQQAYDLWTVAAAAGILDVEEASAGARCAPARMAKQVSGFQADVMARCRECQGCAEVLLAGLAPEADRQQAVWQAAQRSLAEALRSVSRPWQKWDERLQPMINSAVAAERKQRTWKVRLGEVGLVTILAFSAFLLGQYAGGQPPYAGSTSPVLATTDANPDIFFYTVRAGDSLENISARLHLPLVELLALNSLPASASLAPGQRLRLPYASLEQHPPEQLDFLPRPTPTDLPEDAPLEALLVRAARSPMYWQTLWADVQVIDYGPVGYFGPPQQVVRKQVWISQPDYARVIYGPLSSPDQQTDAAGAALAGEPDGTLVISAGLVFGHDFHNGAVYQDLTFDLLPDLDLEKLFFPQELPPGVSVIEHGEREQVAGRSVRVVDASNPFGAIIYRYWIDEQYGFVLRRREFSGADPGIALRDIVVTSMSIDAELPVDVFNPRLYRGDQFALDYSGLPILPSSPAPALAIEGRSGHELLPMQAAPPGYDPSAGRLSFQWSVVPAGGDSYLPGLEMFADGYFLGRVSFSEMLSQPASGTRDASTAILPSPSILICKRSPDGRRLALSLLPPSYAERKSLVLYVLDLFDPASAFPVIPDMSSLGDFAFSKDGSRLAFFACRQNGSVCGVYLAELSGSEEPPRSLMVVDFADYFLWSPDGKLLGFLAAQGVERSWNYLVIRLADGEIIEQGGFDWRRLTPLDGSRAAAWTDGSPVQAGGLDECAAAP